MHASPPPIGRPVLLARETNTHPNPLLPPPTNSFLTAKPLTPPTVYTPSFVPNAQTMERFEVALGEVRNSVSLKAASLEKARVDLRSLASLRTAAQHRSDTVAARRDAAANECPDIERLLRRSRLLEESAQERHRHAVDCLSAARERLAHFSDSPAA